MAEVRTGETTPRPFSRLAFYEELARMLQPISTQDAAEAVLCTLALKLPGGVVVRMERELSPDLVRLMQTCPVHKQAPAVAMGADDFFQHVGTHLDADAREGERVTRFVFRALQPYLGEKVSKEIVSELPKELKRELVTAPTTAEARAALDRVRQRDAAPQAA